MMIYETKKDFIEDAAKKINTINDKINILNCEKSQLKKAIEKVSRHKKCRIIIFDSPDEEDQYINYEIINTEGEKDD